MTDQEELKELRALFDLQWTRMGEATEVWREANPGNELVQPDLGKLLEWLLERVRRYDVIQNWYDTTHGSGFDHDHHCPWPNGDCTCGWEAAKKVLDGLDWRGRSEDEAIEHDRTTEVTIGEAQ